MFRLERRVLLAAGASLLAWAGCNCGNGGDGDGHGEPTPPAAQRDPAEPQAASPDAPDAAPDGAADPDSFVEHTVGTGQTLWEIARAYEVTVDAVMEANGLSPADVRRLREGASLRIPGATEQREVSTAAERREKMRKELPKPEDGAYHFIAQGETLWDLARLYELPMDDIMARNEFSDDDARGLRPGDPVLVPGIDESDVQHVEKERKTSKNKPGFRHTVRPGETVWDLAHSFKVSVSEIMTANGLSTAQVRTLRDGTELLIPGVERDRQTGKVKRQLSGRQRRAQRKARSLGLGTRRAARQILRGRIEPRWIRAAGGNGRLPGTLRWPVTNGWYTRGFGSGAGGYHQAVDIMGEIGWNVRAAARGIVAYSGNKVRGYGNMVMVIHPGGWATMYAHNSVNFVVAGERVPRGGILAELGSTGISRGPHVHFALIHDRRHCDPARLFRPGIKHRGGRLAEIDQVVWRNPKSIPKAVTCQRRKRHPQSRWVVNEKPEGK